jgi:hypothetical protein
VFSFALARALSSTDLRGSELLRSLVRAFLVRRCFPMDAGPDPMTPLKSTPRAASRSPLREAGASPYMPSLRTAAGSPAIKCYVSSRSYAPLSFFLFFSAFARMQAVRRIA